MASLPSLWNAMVSSRPDVTSPSAMKYAVSVGVISMVARRMMPVSPLPPTVAQNSSALGPSGVSWRISPSAVSRSIDRTWLPKLPALWWFLPWMSQAIAPPMVTCRVPGSTGTHSPSGSAARISWSRLTPRVDVDQVGVAVHRVDPVQRGHVDDEAAAVLRVVAVGAAQSAGDHPDARRPATPPWRSPRGRGSTAPARRSARCGPSRSGAGYWSQTS